jgi:hypothetical protein
MKSVVDVYLVLKSAGVTARITHLIVEIWNVKIVRIELYSARKLYSSHRQCDTEDTPRISIHLWMEGWGEVFLKFLFWSIDTLVGLSLSYWLCMAPQTRDWLPLSSSGNSSSFFFVKNIHGNQKIERAKLLPHRLGLALSHFTNGLSQSYTKVFFGAIYHNTPWRWQCQIWGNLEGPIPIS